MDKKDAVLKFFEDAFCIDGGATFVDKIEAEHLLIDSTINLIRLKDSKRGVFYIARVKPKNER